MLGKTRYWEVWSEEYNENVINKLHSRWKIGDFTKFILKTREKVWRILSKIPWVDVWFIRENQAQSYWINIARKVHWLQFVKSWINIWNKTKEQIIQCLWVNISDQTTAQVNYLWVNIWNHILEEQITRIWVNIWVESNAQTTWIWINVILDEGDEQANLVWINLWWIVRKFQQSGLVWLNIAWVNEWFQSSLAWLNLACVIREQIDKTLLAASASIKKINP